MYSIKSNIENTLIIKKSKFITKLYYVNDINEIKNILDNINKEYNDSTHICYAYILDNIEKCNDDNEPNNTAGMPMLNVLKKKNLNHILAIVIRYFGGIKLGVGGLTRAYSNSIIEALNLIQIVELKNYYLIEMEFIYDQLKLVDYILTDKNIIEKTFNETIIYKFYLDEDELSFISNLEKISLHISIKNKVLM